MLEPARLVYDPYADVRDMVVVGRVRAVDRDEGTLLSGVFAIGGFYVYVPEMDTD